MKTIFYEKQRGLHAKLVCVRLSFLLLMLVSYMPIWAQNVTVKGVVVDNKGESLPGVNVIEQGTQNGIVTNIDGEFELNVQSSQSYLKFSFIGYSTISQKVVIGDRMRIVLEDMFQDLNEVVVVGYGTMKKKLLTGATVQIEGDDIQRLNTTTPLGALQSQSPGVMITQNSGMPGEDYKVTIRGLGTTGSSSPLYVIDGVAGGSISSLNPADIESVDVLKDAASAAIYGARAANGVILVTTRQGREGKAELSYDGYVGWQKVAKKPELLNAQQYIYVQNKIAEYEESPARDWSSLLPSYLYDSIQDGTWNGTNWFDESVNDAAPVTSHAVNLTGGSDKSRFSLGFSYISQDGIIGKPKKPESQKYTFRVNSNHILLKGTDSILLRLVRICHSIIIDVLVWPLMIGHIMMYVICWSLILCYLFLIKMEDIMIWQVSKRKVGR
jgi:TonB-linked SusC/RagA family outer membrane protein